MFSWDRVILVITLSVLVSYLRRWSGATVKVFEPVAFFKTASISNQRAVAVNNKGEIAILSSYFGNGGRILLYTGGGKFIREFGVLLRDPLGITFNGDEHLLVCDNRLANSITLEEYHIDGRFLRTVGQFSSLKPVGVVIKTEQNISARLLQNNHGELIVVSDDVRPNRKYSHNSFLSLKHAPQNVLPEDFAFGNGKYFVTFQDVHSVYVFNAKNGSFLYTIGEKGSKEGQFERPLGLAVFGADMLLVCDYRNDRVQLLNQDGQFLSSFGGYGSDLGKMDKPRNIFVTQDGHVFVLEDYGRRIQVFK